MKDSYHYHLELTDPNDEQEPVYINEPDINVACQKAREHPGWYVDKLSTICQFGCGMDHQLTDAEEAIFEKHGILRNEPVSVETTA